MKKIFLATGLLSTITAFSQDQPGFIDKHLLGQDKAAEPSQLAHQQLDDVMEIIDTTLLKSKISEVEKSYNENKSPLNQIRLGIVYHEVALNFGFFNSIYKGFPQKSFDLLNNSLGKLPVEMEGYKSFVLSYQASALSLLSGETKKLDYLNKSFRLFKQAVKKYSSVSYAPEFMRGSVSENLPWILFKKRSYAKKDFESIISKYEKDNNFASSKIMSFTYWAWANQHQSRKHRTKAIFFLEKAIQLDPHYLGGRKRAEELKQKLTTK